MKISHLDLECTNKAQTGPVQDRIIGGLLGSVIYKRTETLLQPQSD